MMVLEIVRWVSYGLICLGAGAVLALWLFRD